MSPNRYARSIRLGDATGVIEVEPVPGQNHLLAKLRLTGGAPIISVSERLRRLFDLSADPERITAALGGDAVLAPRLRAHPGLRVPGAWDSFELAVRAILGQQVSVRGATTLAGRIASTYGQKLSGDELTDDSSLRCDERSAPSHSFPVPEALVAIDPAAIGLTRARAAAIESLAQAIVAGDLDLETAPDPDATVKGLCELPGIGAWTAQYIAMRALREPDAFPTSDLVLRKVLGGARGPASVKQLTARAEAWRPWRAYAALHLWTSPDHPSAARSARTGATKRARERTRRTK